MTTSSTTLPHRRGSHLRRRKLMVITVIVVVVVILVVVLSGSFVKISATTAERAADYRAGTTADQTSDQGAAARSADNRGIPLPPMFVFVPMSHGLVRIGLPTRSQSGHYRGDHRHLEISALRHGVRVLGRDRVLCRSSVFARPEQSQHRDGQSTGHCRSKLQLRD